MFIVFLPPFRHGMLTPGLCGFHDPTLYETSGPKMEGWCLLGPPDTAVGESCSAVHYRSVVLVQ